MSDLPRRFKRLFTVIYGLLTLVFVALVAYAATAGAFGEHASDGGAMDVVDCESHVKEIHGDIIEKGVSQMAPYLEDRLSQWNQADQIWARELSLATALAQGQRHMFCPGADNNP